MGRTKICRFCGIHREEGVFRRSRSKKNLLIMLCAMLEKNEVALPYARKMYNDCKDVRKRICKIHFEEAATHFADIVADIFHDALQTILSEPADTRMNAVVARLEPHRRAIDASCKITAAHLLSFYRDFTKRLKNAEILKKKDQLQSDAENMSAADIEKCREFMNTESSSLVDVGSKALQKLFGDPNREEENAEDSAKPPIQLASPSDSTASLENSSPQIDNPSASTEIIPENYDQTAMSATAANGYSWSRSEEMANSPGSFPSIRIQENGQALLAFDEGCKSEPISTPARMDHGYVMDCNVISNDEKFLEIGV
nr:unnamed protein product [Haemonchus contortus]